VNWIKEVEVANIFRLALTPDFCLTPTYRDNGYTATSTDMWLTALPVVLGIRSLLHRVRVTSVATRSQATSVPDPPRHNLFVYSQFIAVVQHPHLG
jgi:hypothetical protein